LILHGLNVQPGQVVNITAELFHREFVEKLVKAAYKRGAKYVNVDFIDPELARLRVLESQDDDYLTHVPRFIPIKYDDFVEEGAAILRLAGSEDPDSMVDLPPNKVHAMQTSLRQSLKRYYTEGVGKSKIQWTVAAAATPKWAKKVFPELDEDAAYKALWEAIFSICRADQKDCIEAWEKHQKILQERAKKLTDLKIKELHFIGPDTDLKVFLSPKAIFKAGGDKTSRGVAFEANIPTEECFTTPDCRYTTGKVRVTRPVPVNGTVVRDLQLEFQNGEITHFTATEGAKAIEVYLSSDPGAKRLGELALVGIDSPIYQSGRFFEEILYDENAACHIALGFAYRFCLDQGAQMTPDELQEVGCNDSHVHTDFMISSEHVDVTATTYSGETISLIEKGSFVF
jgi:aminopeptidase